jgi:hypothetical protein
MPDEVETESYRAFARALDAFMFEQVQGGLSVSDAASGLFGAAVATAMTLFGWTPEVVGEAAAAMAALFIEQEKRRKEAEH